jgi:hypothetical protein
MVHRTCGGEGLGDDDHERGLGVQPVQRARHGDGVHVGQEAQLTPFRCETREGVEVSARCEISTCRKDTAASP